MPQQFSFCLAKLSLLMLCVSTCVGCGVAKAPPSDHRIDVQATTMPRVEWITTEGSIIFELDVHRAPLRSASFIEMVERTQASTGDGYANSALCRIQNPLWIGFGCLEDASRALPLTAVPSHGLDWPDEIDGPAMQLDQVRFDDKKYLHEVWQREIYPYWQSLVNAGKPVPETLQTWIDTLHMEGTQAESQLLGMDRLTWLSGMGFEWVEGGSIAPFDRGVLASYGSWPRQGDARFVIGLARYPKLDGRVTVFGRVVEGWDVIERIRRLPIDKSRRPRVPFAVIDAELR